MNVADWLNKIEKLHPRTIDLGLERITEVAQRLNIQISCPIITVAGTNGKGSTVAFLESIYRKAGYNLGAYTSPHLLKFNERIQLNAQPVDDDILIDAFGEVESRRYDTHLTYFEFTTLAAFLIFKSSHLDLLLLEVGLGGRLDAVNILDPTLAIITNIDLDHTEWLGEERAEIGFEKAGIFRPHQLAVCADQNPPASVLNQAAEKGVKLSQINHDFGYKIATDSWEWFCKDEVLLNIPVTRLPIQSAASALMAIHLLQEDLPVAKSSIYSGVQQASIPGRFQIMEQNNNLFILDVAHNPAAAHYLSKKLMENFPETKFEAIVGMLGDKDIYNTFRMLLPSVSHWHICELNVPRGASNHILKSHLVKLNVNQFTLYASIKDALPQLCRGINKNFLIFGSFYTVAQAIQLLQNTKGNAGYKINHLG